MTTSRRDALSVLRAFIAALEPGSEGGLGGAPVTDVAGDGAGAGGVPAGLDGDEGMGVTPTAPGVGAAGGELPLPVVVPPPPSPAREIRVPHPAPPLSSASALRDLLGARASAAESLHMLQRRAFQGDRLQRRLPEPARRRTHWDHVLAEMAWAAADMSAERRWKVAVGQGCAVAAAAAARQRAKRATAAGEGEGEEGRGDAASPTAVTVTDEEGMEVGRDTDHVPTPKSTCFPSHADAIATAASSAVLGALATQVGDGTLAAVRRHGDDGVAGSPPALALATLQRVLLATLPLAQPSADVGVAPAVHPLLQLTSDAVAAVVASLPPTLSVSSDPAELHLPTLSPDRVQAVHDGCSALVSRIMSAGDDRVVPAATAAAVRHVLSLWLVGAPCILPPAITVHADPRTVIAAATTRLHAALPHGAVATIILAAPMVTHLWAAAYRRVAADTSEQPAMGVKLHYIDDAVNRDGSAGDGAGHNVLFLPLTPPPWHPATMAQVAQRVSRAAPTIPVIADDACSEYGERGLPWLPAAMAALRSALTPPASPAPTLPLAYLPSQPASTLNVPAACTAVLRAAAGDGAVGDGDVDLGGGSWSALLSRTWAVLCPPVSGAGGSVLSVQTAGVTTPALATARMVVTPDPMLAVTLAHLDQVCITAFPPHHALLQRSIVLPPTLAAGAETVALLGAWEAAQRGRDGGGPSTTSVSATVHAVAEEGVAALAAVDPSWRWQLTALATWPAAAAPVAPPPAGSIVAKWWALREQHLPTHARHHGLASLSPVPLSCRLQSLATAGGVTLPGVGGLGGDDGGGGEQWGMCAPALPMAWAALMLGATRTLHLLSHGSNEPSAWHSAFTRVGKWALGRALPGSHPVHAMERVASLPATLVKAVTIIEPAPLAASSRAVLDWSSVTRFAAEVCCHVCHRWVADAFASNSALLRADAVDPAAIVPATSPLARWQALVAAPKVAALRDVLCEAVVLAQPVMVVCHSPAATAAAVTLASVVGARLAVVAADGSAAATPSGACSAHVLILDATPHPDLVDAVRDDMEHAPPGSTYWCDDRLRLMGGLGAAALHTVLHGGGGWTPTTAIVWDAPAPVIDAYTAAAAVVQRATLHAAVQALSEAADRPVAVLHLATGGSLEQGCWESIAVAACSGVTGASLPAAPPPSGWRVDAAMHGLYRSLPRGGAPLLGEGVGGAYDPSHGRRRVTPAARALPACASAMCKAAVAGTLRRALEAEGGAVVSAALYDQPYVDDIALPTLAVSALRQPIPTALHRTFTLPAGEDLSWTFNRHRKVMGSVLSAIPLLRRHQDAGGVHFSNTFGPPHNEHRLLQAPPHLPVDPSVNTHARTIASCVEIPRRATENLNHPLSRPWPVGLIPPLPDHVDAVKVPPSQPSRSSVAAVAGGDRGGPPRISSNEFAMRLEHLLHGAPPATAATLAPLTVPTTGAGAAAAAAHAVLAPNPPTHHNYGTVAFQSRATAVATQPTPTAAGSVLSNSGNGPGGVDLAPPSSALATAWTTTSGTSGGPTRAPVLPSVIAASVMVEVGGNGPATTDGAVLPPTSNLCGLRARGGEPVWHRVIRPNPAAPWQPPAPFASTGNDWMAPSASRLSWLHDVCAATASGGMAPAGAGVGEAGAGGGSADGLDGGGGDGGGAGQPVKRRRVDGGGEGVAAVPPLLADVLAVVGGALPRPLLSAIATVARTLAGSVPGVGVGMKAVSVGEVVVGMKRRRPAATADSGMGWGRAWGPAPVMQASASAVTGPLADALAAPSVTVACTILLRALRHGLITPDEALGTLVELAMATGPSPAQSTSPSAGGGKVTVVPTPAPVADLGDWTVMEDVLLLRAVAEFGANFELVREVLRNGMAPVPLEPHMAALAAHPNYTGPAGGTGGGSSRSPLLSRMGMASPLTCYGRARPNRTTRQCSERYRKLVSRPLQIHAHLPATVWDVAARCASGAALGAASRAYQATPLHVPGVNHLGLGANAGIMRDVATGAMKVVVQWMPLVTKPGRVGHVVGHAVGMYRVAGARGPLVAPARAAGGIVDGGSATLFNVRDLCGHTNLPTLPLSIGAVGPLLRSLQNARTLRSQWTVPALPLVHDSAAWPGENVAMLMAAVVGAERLSMESGRMGFMPPHPAPPAAIVPYLSIHRAAAPFLPYPTAMPPTVAHAGRVPPAPGLPTHSIIYAPRSEPFRKTSMYIAALRAKERERQRLSQEHAAALAARQAAAAAAAVGATTAAGGGGGGGYGGPGAGMAAGAGSLGSTNESTSQRIIAKVLQLPGVKQLGWNPDQLKVVLSTLIDDATGARIEQVASRTDLSPEAADQEILNIVLTRINNGAGGGGGDGGR